MSMEMPPVNPGAGKDECFGAAEGNRRDLEAEAFGMDEDLLASLGIKMGSGPGSEPAASPTPAPAAAPTFRGPLLEAPPPPKSDEPDSCLLSADEMLLKALDAAKQRETSVRKPSGEPAPPADTDVQTPPDAESTPPDPVSAPAFPSSKPPQPVAKPAPLGSKRAPAPLPIASHGSVLKKIDDGKSTQDTGKEAGPAGEDDLLVPPKFRQLSPLELDDDLEEAQVKQLDLKPFLRKKDIQSPFEIFSPDEIVTEEKFVSKALKTGTVIKERYQVLKTLREKRGHVSYLVLDKMAEHPSVVTRKAGTTPKTRTVIIKEIIPEEMSKDELRERRNRFHDINRILNTFKHPNLAEVYDSFTDEGREYSVMQNIDGLDLEKLSEMNIKPFSEKEVLKWGLLLCDAIEFMHHRPKPFTLGDLNASNIIVDHSGNLKIVSYDLQRFFDVSRTLDFMPDDPTKLYGDITKLARVLYYLLTKKQFNEKALDIEWPKQLSKKMRRLLEIACRDGQLSYGDSRVFRERLTDTQVDDRDVVRKKRYGFPIHKITFEWIAALWKAAAAQKLYMKLLEAAFAVVLILLLWVQPYVRKKESIYIAPTMSKLAYVFSNEEMITINADTCEVIHRLPVNFSAGPPLFTTVKMQLPDEKEPVEHRILLAGDTGGSQVYAVDLRTNRILFAIATDFQPANLLGDKNGQNIWILQGQSPRAFVLNRETLAKERMLLIRNVPGYALEIPGYPAAGAVKNGAAPEKPQAGAIKTPYVEASTLEKPLPPLVLPSQDKEVEYTLESTEREDPPTALKGYVLAMKDAQKLVAFHPETGKILSELQLEYIPGPMAAVRDIGYLYSIDAGGGNLVVIDYLRGAVKSSIPFPGNMKGASDIVYDPDSRKIWVSFADSDAVVSFNPTGNSFGKPLPISARNPIKLLYREGKDQLWVFGAGTREIVIKNTKTGETERKIPLDRLPVSAGFAE